MRLVVQRLYEGELLKERIEQIVHEHRLTAATVISAVGSLNTARIRMAGAQPNNEDIRSYEGPFEIVSLIGNLGQGRTHLHLAFSDSDGQVIGGHLKEGCIVHTTVELVLAVEDGLHFSESTDPKTGFGELHITGGDHP